MPAADSGCEICTDNLKLKWVFPTSIIIVKFTRMLLGMFQIRGEANRLDLFSL